MTERLCHTIDLGICVVMCASSGWLSTVHFSHASAPPPLFLRHTQTLALMSDTDSLLLGRLVTSKLV